MNPGSNVSKVLTALANECLEHEKRIEELEAQLEIEKRIVKRIKESDIPDMINSPAMTIALDGVVIDVASKLRASISKDRKSAAYQWLRENGHSALIKNKMIISLKSGEEKTLNKILTAINDLDLPVSVDVEEDIHHKTVEAFCKRAKEDGEEIPDDLFGIYIQKSTKITKND